jgi:hypothetical protein
MTSWVKNESAIDQLTEAASVHSSISSDFTAQSIRTPSQAVLIWGTAREKGSSPSPAGGSPDLRYADIYAPSPVLAQAEYRMMSPEQISTADQYSFKDRKFRCAYCRHLGADQITIAHRMGETHCAALELLRSAKLPLGTARDAIDKEDRFIARYS